MKNWSDPILKDEVRDFRSNLSERDRDAFDAAVELLAETGPTLGRPVVGEVDLRDQSIEIRGLFGSHLKELRPHGTSIRVLFTFDPQRNVVLLFPGDKAGEWSRWYRRAVAEAARLYREYLTQEGIG